MSGNTEKLKIVFLIEAASGNEERIGDRNVRNPQAGGIGNSRILQMLIETMKRFSIPPEFKSSDGEVISAAQFAKRLEAQGKWGGSVEAGGLLLQVGHIPAMRQGFVLIEEKVSGAARAWGKWVLPFLNEPDFVQAWISDVKYDHWQNASDPIEYTAVGREYSHLPLRSNGLPFPLEQQVIDTSKNPGRWAMRESYIEAIGSTMWLGRHFWRAVGKEPSSALDTAAFRVNYIGLDLVEVVAADQCFCDQTTVDIQNKLRIALFG
jgi:hypothetical protein